MLGRLAFNRNKVYTDRLLGTECVILKAG